MNKKESGLTEPGGLLKKTLEPAIWSMRSCREIMINPSLLKEGEWIETSGRNKIIRSAFFSIPRSVDEIIEHTLANLSASSIERIGQLTAILKT